MRKRIAVIGSGISGLLVARLLATRHDVRLIEADGRLGGHAHTVTCNAHGRRVAADVGFMVFNRRTYPNFVRLLELLGIDSQPSDMSFSVRADEARLEYQSSHLFARRANMLSPRFLRMLWDVPSFNRAATALAQRNGDQTHTLGEFIRRGRYGAGLLPHYLLPMIAAIWSAPPRRVEEFPAAFLFRFLANHGLLQLADRPQWLTIPGGSQRYVAALAAPLADRVRLNSPVHTVRREGVGVLVQAAHGAAEHFDTVVLATHAPQSLAMLVDATPAEREVLGAFAYQSNEAALHTDVQFMPRRPRAWASWNFLAGRDPEQPATVTYDVNRLQRLGAAQPICVTLNAPRTIAPEHLLRPLRFAHPLFTTATVAAQARRDELHRDGRVFFCGAYWGHGFHEDGVNSALAVARQFGITLDHLQSRPSTTRSCIPASTPAASPTCVASR